MNRIILKALRAAMEQVTFTPKAPMLVIDDAESLKQWKENWVVLPTWLGLDVETTGLDAYVPYVTTNNIEIDHAITVIQYFDGLTNYVVNVPKMYQQGLNVDLFDWIRPIHESKRVQKVFFNATFDIKMLWQAGIFTENAVCLMLGAKMCERVGNFNPSLKGIAKNWLGYDMDKGVRATFLHDDVKLGILTDEQLKYAGDDVEILAPLYKIVYEKLAKTAQLDGWAVTNYSLQGTAACELGGVPVDYNEMLKLIDIEEKEYDALIARKAELGLSPYNLNSGEQVKKLYKERFGIELMNTQKETLKHFAQFNEETEYVFKVRSHNKKAQEKLEKTFLAPMFKNKYVPRNYEYAYSDISYMYNDSNRRALKKQFGELPTKTTQKALAKSIATAIKNSYADKDPSFSTVIYDYYLSGSNHNFIDIDKHPMNHDDNMYMWRTNLNTDGAVTGRYSSSGGPKLANLQNIISVLRACTRAPKGWVVCGADYTAIEILIAAYLANETGIIDAINKGLDVHKYAASIMFDVPYEEVTPNQRGTVKAVVFLVLYGGTVYSLAESLGVTLKKAQEQYDKYFEAFPKFKEFVENRVTEARYTGNIRSTSGAYRTLSVKNKSFASSIRKAIQRESKNAAMQSACANIIKRALGNLAREIHKRDWINTVVCVTPVHDELALCGPKHLKDEMKQVVMTCMDNASKEALPTINRPVKVDVARHWAKEPFEETLLEYAHGNVNESDTEEVITKCFGTHTTEYKFWNEHKNNPEHIREFFNVYENANFATGSLDYEMREKLI